MIHLEADVHATEGNPNGFAKDEFVPYLKIAYQIVSKPGDGVVAEGDLYPDDRQRTASTTGRASACPRRGRIASLYDIEPPSAGGLGRHADPVDRRRPLVEAVRGGVRLGLRRPARRGLLISGIGDGFLFGVALTGRPVSGRNG